MINISKVRSFLFVLKLGCSCIPILHLAVDSIFALVCKTNRTGKTNIQKGGMNR